MNIKMIRKIKLIATLSILFSIFLFTSCKKSNKTIVEDYPQVDENHIYVKIDVKELKNYAKKDGAIDIKIDPFICFSEDNIQNIKKNKGIEVRKTFTLDTDKIVKKLEKNDVLIYTITKKDISLEEAFLKEIGGEKVEKNIKE